MTGSDFGSSSLALAAGNRMNYGGVRVRVRSLVQFSWQEVTLCRE